MHKLARLAVAAGAMALIGGAGLAATTVTSSAQDVRVRVGVGTQKHGYNKYRPGRYYYAPPRRYYTPAPRRYYYAPKRNFLNCRWVPHRGRVCW